MKPTELLTGEHRVIEQVLGCLEKVIPQVLADGKIERQLGKDVVAFFRTFADQCHHAKEEALLFPAMEAKGFSPESGPTGVMRCEHEQARAHVRAMDEAIDRAAEGDADAVRRLAEHGRAYIELLREHIHKEDHCLYPMADNAFDEDDQRALLAAFEKVENEEMGPGTHQTYLDLANRLADRFGVPRAEAATAGSHGCCGH